VGPVGVEIDTPFGERGIALTRVTQAGPATWERRGSFERALDSFLLTLLWKGKEESLPSYGPTRIALARPCLSDETVPGIVVNQLACSIAKLLTGESVDAGSFTGAGFSARYRSRRAAEILSQYLEHVPSETKQTTFFARPADYIDLREIDHKVKCSSDSAWQATKCDTAGCLPAPALRLPQLGNP
jgi:hypothetical protein